MAWAPMSLLDAMFSFWMTASMAAFCLCLDADTRKRRILSYVAFGLCCGGGFLTKGFIALAVPVVAVLPYMIYRRRFVELLVYGPIAVVAAALVSAPWASACSCMAPDYWRYFFWVQHIKRFAGAHAQHEAPVWYYLPHPVAGLSCPGWASCPSLVAGLARTGDERPNSSICSAGCCFRYCSSVRPGASCRPISCPVSPAGPARRARPDAAWIVQRPRAVRINGAINLVFGLIGVSPLCLLSRPHEHIYGPGDTVALALGFVAFPAGRCSAWYSCAGRCGLGPWRRSVPARWRCS